MTTSLERGRAVKECSKLTQNTKRRSVVATCLTELNKEHQFQLQKVLHEVREHLYECVFEKPLEKPLEASGQNSSTDVDATARPAGA